MQLSRFFTLAELTHSDTAQRLGLPNQPGEQQIAQLRTLCNAVLDPLREAVAQPLRVSSGYRGPALNARIGGSATSQHSLGEAADLQSRHLSALALFQAAIRLGLPYDQLIYEAQSASVKWLHVSHRPGRNRGEIRVAQFNASGKPVAYPLISAQQALALTEPATRSSRGNAEPAYVERPDEPELAEPATPAPAPIAAQKTPARRTSPAAAKQQPAAKKRPARKTAAKKAPKTVAKKAATKASTKAPAKTPTASRKTAAAKSARG